MLRLRGANIILVATALMLNVEACSGPIARPKFKKIAAEHEGDLISTSEPTAEGAAAVDPETLGSSRLWRLTVQQFANTVRKVLDKDVQIETKFDPGSRPEDGFGIDAAKLGIDSIYASNLETVTSDLLAASTADLTKSAPCLKQASIVPDCLENFIKSLALTTFRRPINDVELKRYKDLFVAVKVNFSNDESLAAVAEALLRSPFTQFRLELGSEVAENPGVNQLSGHELATQIAFAITDFPPDKELLAAAENGDLMKKDKLEAHIRRLMASDAFDSGFTDFVFRWTGLTWIGTATKSAMTYPEYKPEVREAMLLEAKAYLRNILRDKKGSFKALMTSNETTITPPLASYYKAGIFNGTKTVMTSATERAGLFTLPAIITANSPANQTGPVQRGVFLLKRLMCTSPPLPPANLKTELPEIDPSLTLRERFAVHSNVAGCSSCHLIIDPFGFSMENYDAVGRFRDKDNGKLVDSSGSITKSLNSNNSFKTGVELLNFLSNSKDVHECFVKQAFRYTFGRSETLGDEALIKDTYAKFLASGLDINELFVNLYSSNAFRFRKDK